MRLEVTRKSHLAICAMVALAAAPERMKTADLAAELNAAPAFLAQVLSELARTGWVESSPGPTGGYRLLVDTAELSVIEVVEAFEGPTEDDRCVVANAPCGAGGYCALHEGWTEARSVLIKHLRCTTVDQVASSRPFGTDVSIGGTKTTVSAPDQAPDRGGKG